MTRVWPATMAEFERREAAAIAKYRPLVLNLQPWEITALHKSLSEALEELRKEAQAGLLIAKRDAA